MKFGSTIQISHPNFQDVVTLGDDSFIVEYAGYDGEVEISISDDYGLTWNHITNHTPPEGEIGLHHCQPMIDGSPFEYTRLKIAAVGDSNFWGISDYFKTPYGDGTYSR